MSDPATSTVGGERRPPRTFRPGGGYVLLRGWMPVAAVVAIATLVVWLMPISAGGARLAMWAAILVIVRVVWDVVVWRCERYTLTGSNAVWESGVIHRLRVDMPLDRVQNTVLYRSIGERLLGLGTIGVASAATDSYEIVWRSIERPGELLEELRAVIAIARAKTHTGGANDAVMPSRVGEQPARAVLPVIGLTGGVGSGKSTVARFLGESGCLVIDSDQRAKAALDRPDVRDQLVTWWGDGILGVDGRVDRSKVAGIVFSNPAERARLEGVVHPIVRQDRAAMIAEAAGRTYRAVVIDAPLLFEAGLDKECDAVIFVEVPREMRLARVKSSRGWDEEELDRRERAQLPLAQKRARSSHVVENAGDLPALRRATEAVLSQVLDKSAEGS